MEKSDFEKASHFWTEKEKSSVKMDSDTLKIEAEKFIKARNTCALATGFDCFVRCTPIEYNYIDGAFYLFSEGGRKFSALEKNTAVCIAIFDSYTEMSNINGMQVTGNVCFVEPFSAEYNKLLTVKGIPVSALKNLDYTMYLLKVIPSRIDMLCSSFKQKGFDSRQTIEF